MILSRNPMNYALGLLGLGEPPFVPPDYIGSGAAGLGDVGDSTTVLNYPGMPVDSAGINNPIPPGGMSPSQLAALSASNAAYFSQPSSSPSGFSAWLQANPSAAWWGVGALAVLAFLSEGRR